MTTQTIRTIQTVTLFFLDALMVALAFVLAYQLRIVIPWPEPWEQIVPLWHYTSLLILQVVCVVTTLFFYRQYYIPRALSRVDSLYYVFAGSTIGTMMAVALSSFLFKDDEFIAGYPRAMVVYALLLTILLIMLGRTLHQFVRLLFLKMGWGTDRLLVVGTGETARIIVQRILWTPQLGYDLVGIVNGLNGDKDLLGVPVLGTPDDLPELIERLKINEVIIAIPEKGHREIVEVISHCERGRVSIKVFPDVFQLITSEAGIDHLGGLPLLSVRDFALRGYLLIFKRLLDLIGASIGLIFLSPLMLLVAIAIKLESPGSAFFVQERMSLDGRPFWMIKFRSMRNDAEKHGPGWTVTNDPRQTRLGKLIRKIEIDELPNLINVFLGEMSLVGPRPEQAHYVELFRESVPRYMERHREKGGMTGWAQVNGLRGDTSITERTKYDLWYSENWSIWLDIKILIRTVWQIFERQNEKRHPVKTEVVIQAPPPEAPPTTTPPPATAQELDSMSQ